jgi:UDP-N-acetyl-D-glucosamine dehydrogenase
MRVVVVALGKVGLPVAVAVARAGHDVIGCDLDPQVCAAVNAGTPPFPGEAGLDEALAEVVGAGRLTAQVETAQAVATGPDLVVVVPPLLVDRDGRTEWRALDSAVDAVGAGLQPGTTVAVETTVPVGTTRRRIAPRLQARSGLAPERDFHVAFSPERVYSGRVLADLASYPKLVGGLSPEGERRASALYGAFLPAEIRPMGSAEAAEMTKLVEATYRDVNIALANEFARFADRAGINLAAVIEAANSQPFSHVHSPGVAVGGHCTPVYPRFYLEGDPHARLPAVAREVNEGMPAYAVEVLAGKVGGELSRRRVLILGIAYRGGVKATAFSGAYALRDELVARDAVPVAADPLYSADELEAEGFQPWDGEPVDGAILQADHSVYADLAPGDVPGARAVVDGRGILNAAAFSAEGVAVVRLGEPRSTG